MINPLFPLPDKDKDDARETGFIVRRKGKDLKPISSDLKSEHRATNPAVSLIRQKIEKLYKDEPDAKKESDKARDAGKGRSRHQEFMYKLSTSGKSLAEIQTEWHEYYTSLPDHEKHEVWQEFYESNSRRSQHAQAVAAREEKGEELEHPAAKRAKEVVKPVKKPRAQKKRAADKRSAAEIKKQLLDKISAGGKLQAKHHLHSLAFGLGMGFLVLFIFLFTFFNQYVITPFIQPGSSADATPLIIGPNTASSDKPDEVIVPKINVEIPVDYNINTTDESAIENDLEDGVIHYPTTVDPGQQGNAAYFGHSSNNIFNPGHYKFAFVLLHTLVPGDTFYLIKSHHVYAYKVISKKVVPPSDVSVLNAVPGQVATATLITCDPPGTSINRLVVVGQQVSPNPSGDTLSSTQPAAANSSSTPSNLPGNGPSLWHRIFGWL